jgi:hypothetical protein
MRRSGIVFFAVYVLFTITIAVFADDTKTATTKQPQKAAPATQAAPAPAIAPATQADSPLVRAAKVGLEARMHPRARIVINSTTLNVGHWYESSTTGAATASPEAQGRSYASGNQNDAAAIAAKEKSVRDQRAAAETARVAALRQEQTYMLQQNDEPYSEILDDHVTKRLEEIPDEIKNKPPM